MRDLFTTLMYIEGLGLIAFAALVVIAIGFEAYTSTAINNWKATTLTILTLFGIASYLLTAALWDITLAWYVSYNPNPLPPNPFFIAELLLQAYQTVAIWTAIPMVFVVRWVVKRSYRRK